MEPTVVAFLDSVRGIAITLSLYAFVAINGVALAALLATRSRALVQRWTSPWLAANIVLLGTGVGVPLVAGLCKSVVSVVATSVVSPPPASPVD